MSKLQRRAIFIDDITKQVIFSDDIVEWTNKQMDEEDEEEEDTKIDPIYTKPGASWLPALGYSKQFDGHTFLAGATESGKSYFIKKMILNDRYQRPVILFTNLEKEDSSFQGIEDMIKFNPKTKYNWEWVLENDTNKILIFDDIRNNVMLKNYRDKMIEEGRHKNTVVICVNHKLQEWRTTMTSLNDCRFIVTFPSANRGKVKNYIKEEGGLNRKQLNKLMRIATKEGRYLIVHKFAPMCLASQESIFKL